MEDFINPESPPTKSASSALISRKPRATRGRKKPQDLTVSCEDKPPLTISCDTIEVAREIPLSTRPRRSTKTTSATPSTLSRRASSAVKEKEAAIAKIGKEKKVGKPHPPSSLYSCLMKNWKVVEELGDASLVEAMGKILASSSFSSEGNSPSSQDPSSLPFLYLANSLGAASRSHLCSLRDKEKDSSPSASPLSPSDIVEQLTNQLATFQVEDESVCSSSSVLPKNLTFGDHEMMMSALSDFPWTVCCIGTDVDGEHLLLSRYEGRGGHQATKERAGFLTRRVRMKEMRNEKMAPSFFLSEEGKGGGKKRTCVEEGQWGFGELMRTLHRGTEITPKNPLKATKKVCVNDGGMRLGWV